MKKLLVPLLVGLLVAGLTLGCNRQPAPSDGGIEEPNGDQHGNGNGDQNGATQPEPQTVLAVVVDGDVVLIDEDDGKAQVTDFGDVQWVSWSPDGNWLLIYIERGQVWTMKSDGTELNQLAAGIPSEMYRETTGYMWHPDSNQVACVVSEQPELKIFNLAQGTVRTITLPAPAQRGPWWNQSGQKLAVQIMMPADPAQVRDDSYNEEEDWEEFYHRYHLVILDVQGNQLFCQHSVNNLTWVGDDMVYTVYGIDFFSGYFYAAGVYALPSSQATSTQIAQRGGMILGPLQDGLVAMSTATDIHIYDFNTRTMTHLCAQDYYVTYSEFEYPFEFAPAYNANKVAVLALHLENEPDEMQFGYWDLDVYDLGSGQTWTAWPEVYQLAEGTNQWLIPVFWAKNGQHLYVYQRADQRQELWQVPVDGGQPRLILEDCQFASSRPGI